MLKTLEELGFLSTENGEIAAEDKQILLHIYKSKLNGEKIDSQQIIDALDGENISYQEFLAQVSSAHKTLAHKLFKNVDVQKLGSARAFEKLEERVDGLKAAFEEKQAQYQAMGELLSNSQSFDAFCEKVNVSNKAAVKQALQKKFEDARQTYLKSKVGCLSVGVEYNAWVDAREGKMAMSL